MCDLGAIWLLGGASLSTCSTNQLLVLRGRPDVLLSSIRLVSRGSSSCVREVWMLQVARSGKNAEQANTTHLPHSAPPICTAMGEYIAPPGIPDGRALLGRAPRGKAGWQWWGLVAGAVSWMGGGGCLQQRSVLPSINTQVVQPTFL